MAPLRRRFLLAEGVGLLLRLLLLTVRGSGSSSSHSLRYFYTTVSEPGPGRPHFMAVGYVDEQPIARYDSLRRRAVPLAPWMEQAGKEDPQYWERETQTHQGTEAVHRANLETLREHFHQENSTGVHTFQWMCGCEVGPDGRFRGGNNQYAYNGEDFLSLDLETITWTAHMPQAKPTKKKLDDNEVDQAQRSKDYLEETCVMWLQRYLDYGKETLLRTEAPTGKVACKKGYDGQEILFCQLYGFYPKEIEVIWMKDEVDQKPDTLTGGVVPNVDGTYHTWLSIEVDPKERERYLCRVGHDSLLEPLDLAWEGPASNTGLFVVACGGVLVALLGVIGVIFFIRKHSRTEGDYKHTPERSRQISDSSRDSGCSDPGSESSVTKLV